MLETVEIKVKPCKGNEKGKLVINKEDLKPEHTLYEEKPKGKKK